LITTTDPRTGVTTKTRSQETTPVEVDAIAQEAQAAMAGLEGLGRAGRARLLEAVADSLAAAREDLVRTADQETGLGETRLTGELNRAVFQFRLFAEALREGSYVEAMIDHAAQTPLGPGPDLRRMLRPLGPVAVFGASNFPFAFSVAGGDTASALAAGCPVVLKAHDSHPLTSLRSFEAIAGAVAACGAPPGTIAMVFGQDAAGQLIGHPAIKAVSFTGSLGTGRVLLDIVNRRPDPIPFYGELSSLNPLVITPSAARARAAEIAQGLFTSFTGSGGQLCTKPGVAFVPSGPDGDALVRNLADLTERGGGHVLLNRRISEGFAAITDRLIGSGAALEARGPLHAVGGGFVAAPTLLTASARDLSEGLTEECFGPLVVVVRYDHLDEATAAFRHIPASLTATIHFEDDEADLARDLTDALAPSVGRIVYNGYPTGVRVSWAQHHGGPWPSTNSEHTSVGVTAIRRFLRPFVWQDAPAELLPQELEDADPGIPRRIDGRLTVPGTSR
jgi:NADP-dependent aldehyde dehydrogenase